ncbi:hypothetical protein [Listeria ilorinensis]|uniref:hypothetical protein n=1 Tax=Listeria ilorinensis TaxID=2867439 RepID=UPI001EF43EF9|nr:hypothetical protein [Listeria ilorinensis]
MLKAGSNTFKYVTTFKTKASIYRNTASNAATIAGLVGGPVGAFTTIVGIISGFRSYGLKEVYIKIDQYYNSYTHYVKNYFYFYKKSNYTSLIKSTTESFNI